MSENVLEKLDKAIKKCKRKSKQKKQQSHSIKESKKKTEKTPSKKIAKEDLIYVIDQLIECDDILKPVFEVSKKFIQNSGIYNSAYHVHELLRLYDLYEENRPLLEIRTTVVSSGHSSKRQPVISENEKSQLLSDPRFRRTIKQIREII